MGEKYTPREGFISFASTIGDHMLKALDNLTTIRQNPDGFGRLNHGVWIARTAVYKLLGKELPTRPKGKTKEKWD